MRLFLAGASGVIGIRLVPLLVKAGHVVAGMPRSPEKAGLLRALGATPVVCDVYDATKLEQAVIDFAPDLVMHQLTDLPDDQALIASSSERNARIRREGTRNLLGAARAASVERFFAQSVAWKIAGDGGEATQELERTVLASRGVVLRYGRLYGEGTYYPNSQPEPPRVHVDVAARRTIEVLEAPSGIITIAD
ncbi:MAG TPA: NAD-dependent epimerase/dehydratase family protein [Gemmatimonadaceae bacterium]